MKQTDLSLNQVILLDKVQKKLTISKEDAALLRKDKLIEGRLPNLYVSSGVAQATGNRAEYTRNKAFDKRYYKDLILAFIRQHTIATPEDIQKLVMDKLSDILTEQQRKDRVRAILYEMSSKDKTIFNAGKRGLGARWKQIG